MSLAKVKMGCLCYGPLRILWAPIRNSFFLKLMANVIWNALRSVRRCHLLHAVVAYQSKSVETEDSYSVWLLVPATVTSLRRVLFFLQLTNANRYSFAPQCKYFSLLCGLKRTDPVPFHIHVAAGVCAFIIIAATHLSAGSTCVGNMLGSSHQPAPSGSCAGCIHTCKTEADSWQLELGASRIQAQKCRRDAAALT